MRPVYIGLLGQVKEILRALDRSKEQEVKLARDAAIVETAKQVAHDIRTPLAVLRSAMELKNCIEDRPSELARNALARIDAIASDLLSKSRGKGTVCKVALSPLVREIVESQIFTRSESLVDLSLSISDECREVQVCIEPVLFTRVLNNLINNAFEAIRGRGKIDVLMSSTISLVEIVVRDSGRGIEPSRLSKLMFEQVSFGKENGNGLGLYHAHELDGDRGDRVGKVLYESGYRNLFLATGYAAEDLTSLPFFNSVVGKDPPF